MTQQDEKPSAANVHDNFRESISTTGRGAVEPELEALRKLVAVMKQLLAPGGCAWDREQTPQSLRPYVIEEAYEVVDALDEGDAKAVCEELGDLLFQVVFQAELAEQHYGFSLTDVIDGIKDKLVRRHPHVFGDEKAAQVDDAIRAWERAKAKERAGKSALSGVPKSLPSLLRGQRVIEKALATQLRERPQGLRAADMQTLLANLLGETEPMAVNADFGRLLFLLVRFARDRDLDVEASLRATMQGFETRFREAESRQMAGQASLAELDGDDLRVLWEGPSATR